VVSVGWGARALHPIAAPAPPPQLTQVIATRSASAAPLPPGACTVIPPRAPWSLAGWLSGPFAGFDARATITLLAKGDEEQVLSKRLGGSLSLVIVRLLGELRPTQLVCSGRPNPSLAPAALQVPADHQGPWRRSACIHVGQGPRMGPLVKAGGTCRRTEPSIPFTPHPLPPHHPLELWPAGQAGAE